MKFISSRGAAPPASLSEALLQGLAPDGGLYLPARLPRPGLGAFGRARSLPAVATALLAPCFEGDPLEPTLGAIIEEAFSFPAPLCALRRGRERLSLLELFHGPTSAFKDFGAGFLAACLARIERPASRPLTILVATSGDTGGAAAAAFHRRPGIRVVVLYPDGLVSRRQEQQLNCWGDNVTSLAVAGSFDDCQRLVKQAFADEALRAQVALSSANSINVGRLLPQAAWFAAASLRLWDEEGRAPSFAIPSGNLGHATACAWAREMGLPVGEILLAHNANRAVPEHLGGAPWRPRPSIATIASAMDVGDPSNLERLQALWPAAGGLGGRLLGASADDAEIRAAIRDEHRRSGTVLCPHTAAALHAWQSLAPAQREESHWVVAATAHPAKFPEVVEPLVGRAVAPPPALAALLSRPAPRRPVEADYAALRDLLVAA